MFGKKMRLTRKTSAIEMISKNPDSNKKQQEILKVARKNGYTTLELAAGLYKGRRKKEEKKDIVKEIVDFYKLPFAKHDLKRIKKEYTNAFKIDDKNLIFLYPVNDGMPTCSFEFYKDGKLIIDNNNEYSEITNLDEIILQLVEIYNEAIVSRIVLDPYYFMLELTDEIKENYHGKAKLVITEKAIRNQCLNENNFEEARKYYINHFLDHFIGWNFGVSVNRNQELKDKLEELNKVIINFGIREYAGAGLEVFGSEDKEYCGLQHYKLPTENQLLK